MPDDTPGGGLTMSLSLPAVPGPARAFPGGPGPDPPGPDGPDEPTRPGTSGHTAGENPELPAATPVLRERRGG